MLGIYKPSTLKAALVFEKMPNRVIKAVSKLTGIPVKFIPKKVILQAVGETPSAYAILIGKKSHFSDPEWENELGHLINFLVVGKEGKRKEQHSIPDEELKQIASNLLSRIRDCKREVVHNAALGLIVLAYSHPEIVKVSDFNHTIQESIINKYPHDDYLQGVGNKLLNLEEELTDITLTEDCRKPFEYPPFQKALPYFPDYGYQATFYFKHDQLDKQIMKSIISLIEELKAKCKEIDDSYPKLDGLVDPHSGFNIGFDLDYWLKWCELLERKPSIPVKKAARMMGSDTTNFMKQHHKLKYTKGHIWFYLKTETKGDCEDMLKIVRRCAESLSAVLLVTTAYKKNEGRLFGGQFMDGITSAVDAVSMIREVLIQPMPVSHNEINPEGGTFAFMQFFTFDRPVFTETSQPITENMIGRTSTYSETLARLDDRCHIKRARVISPKDGTNTELIRQSLPHVVESKGLDRGPLTSGLFFVAFGKSSKRFDTILNSILGDPDGFTQDLMINNVQGIFGKLFYCPNTLEISALPNFTDNDVYPSIPFWNSFASKNPSFFYNHIQYLHTMSTNSYVYKDPPSKRILFLMSTIFARWHSTWIHKFDVPRLPHLREFLNDDEKYVMQLSIQERKGYSYRKMLGEVFTSSKPLLSNGLIYGQSENFDTYRLSPKELIVGVTDRLSFGSGKEVMPYLKEGSETTLSVNLALTEAGNMGHIVPGHVYILKLGVPGMLENLRDKLEQECLTEDQRKFYQSAVYAYEGVQLYLLRYAELARKTAKKMKNRTTQVIDRRNLRKIANRMVRLAYGDPKDFTFHDALQMIFSMHCCLHLIGQAISVGRLDQLLITFYNRDIANGTLKSKEEAQELIDAFFAKFDEHAVLNQYNIPYGHTTLGNTCVTGRGGPFATGDSMNQWIQQITVGGCDENGQDAFNDITMMCLKSARRLPLNAPCLSLRLTPTTPKEIKEEAAKALLSGGAHPILYHDRKMVDGLYEALRQSFIRSNIPEPDDLLKIARDFCSDGCFEPMFPGRTEFKFGYVFLLQAVIFAINSGANYQPAGPLNLAGGVSSYRTPLAVDIHTFEEFKMYFRQHLKLLVVGLYGLILNSYGNPWEICPSPLLSCLLEGCVDSGKDMTNGGSRFHILTPMYVGFTNTVNSLYNVKKIVYDENDVASLSVLKMALINNWGDTMVEPFYDTTGETGSLHTEMWAQRYKDLRKYALGLPKFGSDNADDEINEMAGWLAAEMEKIAYEALYEKGPVSDRYEELKKKHSVPGKPFLFQIMTGSGTFENYVSVGAACAATPDGRLNGQPIASDISQQPYPQDQPVPPGTAPLDIIDCLKPHNEQKLDKFIPNGCEVDITIPETFPMEPLLKFIDAFINEETGSNLVTVTCVDGLTMERAMVQPQKFDLVRNRMGGWTNFFVCMFDEHKKQHARRPVFGPHNK